MNNTNITIETERLILSSLNYDTLDFTLKLRNIKKIRENFFNSNKVKKIDHLEWFKIYSMKQDDYIFVISLKDSFVKCGQISIYNVIKEDKAEIGRFMCLPEHQRKGYIKEAVQAMIKWAKEMFNIKEIYLYVLKNNKKAIDLYTSLGFIKSNESFIYPKNNIKHLLLTKDVTHDA